MKRVSGAPSKARPSSLEYDYKGKEGEEQVQFGFRGPVSLMAMMEKMYHDPALHGVPKSALFRWGLHQALLRVATDLKNEKLADQLRLQAAAAELKQDEANHNAFVATIQESRQVLTRWLAEGMSEKAAVEWRKLFSIAKAVHDPHLRKRYVDALTAPEFQEIIHKADLKWEGPKVVE